MQKLNFPSYSFRFKNSENKISVFDSLRKKFIILTPEEWVRQHVVHYLLSEKKFPASLLSVERQLKVNNLIKRYDILAFNPNGSIHLMVECKASSVKINQDSFDQIARYNLSLNATYLMVTNGLEHYYCQMDYEKEKYHFLEDIPSWGAIRSV